jgi:hypothetical protein
MDGDTSLTHPGRGSFALKLPPVIKNWLPKVEAWGIIQIERHAMSAFGGKTVVNHQASECLLIARSGHSTE